MENMNIDTIKICPFCGGEANSHMTIAKGYIDRPDGQLLWFVECTNEKCSASSGVYETVEEAIEAWNTRKPLERIVERLERLKKYEESGSCPKDGMCDSRDCQGCYTRTAIDIVKEEGGLNG